MVSQSNASAPGRIFDRAVVSELSRLSGVRLALMHPRLRTLKRSTRFFGNDDDHDDKGLESRSLASNHENDWSPQFDDPTAVTGLVTSRKAQPGQETIRIPSSHGSLILEIPVTFGSRWAKYKRVNARNLGGIVHIVVELPAEEHAYLIRDLSVARDEVSLFRKRWLSHQNLCKTHEIIEEDSGSLYCVTEPADITLRHVSRWPRHNEEQLLAITRQVR